jgi:hypothetical protein
VIGENRMNGFSAVRYHAEIRPDRPVEYVGTDDFQRGLGGMDHDRTIAHVTDGVDHERQAGQVVEVRVSNEDMIDLRQFGDRQITDAGSGVDQDVVVDQQRGGAQMSPADSAATTEDAYLHCFAACAGPSQAGGQSNTGSRNSG